MASILITRYPFESILSGEEWHTIELAEALRRRGHTVHYTGSCRILLQQLSDRKFSTTRSSMGPLPVSVKNLILFTIMLPWLLLRGWWHFLVLLRKYQIGSVYMMSLSEKLILTPLCLMLGKRVVWVEHQRFGRWMYSNPYRPVYAWLSRRVHVIGVSPMYQADLLHAGVAPASIHIIHNGIDLSRFHQQVIPVPWKQQGVHIGTVARLYHDKGIDVLIRAFAELGISDTYLHILGEGPEKPALTALCAQLGIADRVSFHVPYTEIPRAQTPNFMKSLDIFVLSSRKFDPFGLVVAESMAVGTPTVITDVCGISTLITHDQDAMIVPADTTDALAQTLITLCHDTAKRRTLGKQGAATAASQFDMTRMVDAYEEILLG